MVRGILVLRGAIASAMLCALAAAVIASGWAAHPVYPGVGAARSPRADADPLARRAPAPAAAPAAPAQLPRGGRTVFPAYRLVGYSGGPNSAAFGRLGVGDLDRRVSEIERVAAGYTTRYAAERATGSRPLPVLELIAVVAQVHPGADGRYRARVPDAVIEEYLAAARRHRALLLLGVQPGRSDLLTETQGLARWLREPDVGVALDPEWQVGPGQRPGQVFGAATGRQLDAVAAYLESLVDAGGLPQKVMVVHQLSTRIVRDPAAWRARPGVAGVLSVDGIGTPAAKQETWASIVSGLPAGIQPGFKLFFDEDQAAGGPLMTPAQVLALRPVPAYVLYE